MTLEIILYVIDLGTIIIIEFVVIVCLPGLNPLPLEWWINVS